MADDPVLFERRNGVAWVTLHRPEVKNAINAEMRERLLEAFATVADDPALRCLVLTGAGGAFSSGADLSGGKRTEGSVADVIREGVQRVFRALWELDVPTIAAVDGVAAGFGSHLALACDLVLASEEARFIEVFARRGLAPDGGGAYLLPRLIGLAKAKELVFFADAVAAADAERIGLVNRVVPGDQLEQEATAWAELLAAGPTRALGLAKRLLNRSLESSLDTALEEEALAQEEVAETADLREGLAAFKERRDPRFTGT